MNALVALLLLAAPPPSKNCQSDVECFRSAAASCAPAKLVLKNKVTFGFTAEGTSTYVLEGKGEAPGRCHAMAVFDVTSVTIPPGFMGNDGGAEERKAMEQQALAQARSNGNRQLDCDIAPTELLSSLERQQKGSYSSDDFPGCGPLRCEPPAFPLSPGCKLGKCVRGVQQLECSDGPRRSSCRLDGPQVITTDTCTLGCTARGWPHLACVHPKQPEPAAPTPETEPEYPPTWEAYRSRGSPPPVDTSSFSITVIQGRNTEWTDRLYLSSAKANATVVRVHTENGAATISRGVLDSSQVKALMKSLRQLRPWDMNEAGRQSNQAPAEQEKRHYEAELKLGKDQSLVRVSNGCPSKGPCVQLELLQMLQGLSSRAKPEKIPVTKVEAFNPPPSKGAPVDGKCSHRPVRDDWFYCEVGTTKYDHCLFEDEARYACYTSPFNPMVPVHKVGETMAGYLWNQPWAVVLESGEKCVYGPAPGRWNCFGGSLLSDVVPGPVWVALRRNQPPLAVKSAFGP